MFDCVVPTRNARNGMLFTWNGVINIRNKKWKRDHSPLDPAGRLHVDQAHSKAYLRHLMISGEMLGPMIATLHNLAFYLDLMEWARERIEKGDFKERMEDLAPNLMQRL
jgi:queuine tRNA-ribosyltransferase